MVTVATIIPSLERGALNLQDVYFHITIHPSHQRFLQFTLGPDHFQYKGLPFRYKVLPFRLSTASQVFSKVLAVIAAYLCRKGILFPNQDDYLLKVPN